MSLFFNNHLLLLLLLLLFPLSMHACTARPLGFHDHEGLVQQEYTEKPNLEVSPIQPKDSLVLNKQVKGATSGTENIVPSSSHGFDLANASETNEGSKRLLARMMLGKKTTHVSEEMVDDSKENEAMEDVEVMDYAQPHRKPPIHNEKN